MYEINNQWKIKIKLGSEGLKANIRNLNEKLSNSDINFLFKLFFALEFFNGQRKK